MERKKNNKNKKEWVWGLKQENSKMTSTRQYKDTKQMFYVRHLAPWILATIMQVDIYHERGFDILKTTTSCIMHNEPLFVTDLPPCISKIGGKENTSREKNKCEI